MNKFTDQFWKYALCLLIVGVVLVAVGGLSVGRTTMANKRELDFDMTYKEKVTVISNENMELKTENAALKSENEALSAEKQSAEEKLQAAEIFIQLEACMEKKDYEKAAELAAQIAPASLPDAAKAQFEEFQKILDSESK